MSAHPRAVTSDAPALTRWGREIRGVTFRPWQELVVQRALERDADGKLVWPVVVVLTPRQSGKSTLLHTLATWWASQGLQVLHVANRLSTASEVWQHAARWADATGLRVLRKQDQPELTFPGVFHPTRGGDLPGRYFVQAAKATAGVGFTLDRALVDEAFTVSMTTVTQGISPAMSDVEDRQLWLVSTAGDSASDLLRHYREAGLAAVKDPTSASVCLLEWSAPEGAAWDSEDTARAASPWWTPSRAEYLTEQRALIPEGEYRSQYLNQWVSAVAGWIPPTTWEACAESGLDDGGQWRTVAACVEQTLDGRTHCLTEAGVDDTGTVRTRYSQWANLRELEDHLDAVRAPHTRVTPSYLGRLAKQRDLVGQRELDPAMRAVSDLLGRKGVRHPDDQRLTESALVATERVPHTGTGISLGAPGGANLAPIRSWCWAVWLAAANPARKPQIVSRRNAK